MSHPEDKHGRPQRGSFIKYLLVGAVLAGGLAGGYGIIGARATAQRTSAHSVSARATNVPSTPATEATATEAWATRMPAPTDPAMQSADMATLQVEMGQLQQQVVELKSWPAAGAGVSDATLAELQQMIDVSAAGLAYLDALVTQQASAVPTPAAQSPALGRMGEMGGRVGQGTQPGTGLHGHH